MSFMACILLYKIQSAVQKYVEKRQKSELQKLYFSKIDFQSVDVAKHHSNALYIYEHIQN